MRALCAAICALLFALPARPLLAQANDDAYTANIREFTTEPYFTTDLVDHLPASPTVPTPLKTLGHIAGAPGILTYSQDLYRYYRALAAATKRVLVMEAPDKSEEGKTQLLVLVSDEDNLANLDHYRDITARLADPRKTPESDAHALIAEGKPFYWLSGSIHSPETGSVEMLMELAYRLAVDDSPWIKEIRRSAIVMITPVLEVDGHDRMVDLARYHTAYPERPIPPLVYWGHYVAHDNNRDSIGMALALSRNQMRTFLDYHPQILHDLHESVPFLYASTGTGPYNAWLDPIVIDEWHDLAYNEIEELTKRGVPGVWTHGYYDGWAPNYMFYAANGHNSIGRFYETFGAGFPDTLDMTVRGDTSINWYRPNPPLAHVKWSLRDNINIQESGILTALHYVASNHERFLDNFYRKSKRSVAKAANEGPAAYLIPADTPRPALAASLVGLLQAQGVEVQALTKPYTASGRVCPAGTFVVRMDQPYSREADMLLDTQYYSPSDPPAYDDTGWTLGPLYNVETVRVTDAAVLKAPMQPLLSPPRVPGRVEGAASPAYYVIDHRADSGLAALPFRLRDVKMEQAEAPFHIAGKEYHAGAFIIPVEGNPPDLAKRLASVADELGFTAVAAAALPTGKTHPLSRPRIALVHTWTNTQDEGWFRIELDRLKIPYSYISVHAVRDTADLRRRFDVVLIPPVGDSPQGVVLGVPEYGQPIPWKASSLMPNVGLSPDQTADIRGGLGIAGVEHLHRFAADGGLLIAVGDACSLPVDYAITSDVAIERDGQLKTSGSVFRAVVADRKSPIVYGYDDAVPVYFNGRTLLHVAKLEEEEPKPGHHGSGRGTASDPDVVQGMPQAGPPPKRPEPKEGVDQFTAEQRLYMYGYVTPAAYRPRVVLRFAKEEKDLLISGMLSGGSALADRPAIVDAPVGRGHVVLFADNPMWRHTTPGSHFLLYNAILDFDHLDAGRTVPQTGASAPRPGGPF